MIYLDNHSTTQVDPRVLERMLPFFAEHFGNASSSTHEMGREARRAVEDSRALIAECIGAETDEIYFTSGATESNNLAIRGLATHRSTRRREILSALTEHRAVLDPVARLEREGFVVQRLVPEDASGSPGLDQLDELLSERTALVSLMWANNEIGTCLPISAVAEKCRRVGSLLHSDAAQALGRLEIDLRRVQVDLVSLSGHKLYGPKGVGALFVRRGVRLKPILDGGGHEGGKRSGTLNVPGIVGFAAAVELARDQMESENTRIRGLMRRFDSELKALVPGVELNGPPVENRLPGNLNYRLEGIDAETLTLNLPEICLSTGSACTSAEPEPSHVLQAIGLTEMEARSSIRVGMGRFNTTEEIETAVREIAAAIHRLRGLN